MSLHIIKAGLLDSLQDGGRHGFAHLGLGPGGWMDPFSGRQANALVGNDLEEPVIELHFPAAQIRFEASVLISVCGADFGPAIDDNPIPIDHPVWVRAGGLLRFTRWNRGARSYLAVAGGFDLPRWLGSGSTAFKLGRGGWQGRALQAGDVLPLRRRFVPPGAEAFGLLPWTASYTVPMVNEVEVVIGPEWYRLGGEAQEQFLQHWFAIRAASDRMGYRLEGAPLRMERAGTLLSSAVTAGTVQLLPDGQLLVLTADHQTTGGYPRIAQVISAHLPILAQRRPGDALRFRLTHLEEAEEKLMKQRQYLEDVREAAAERLRELCS